jgi:hypothetical protein
MSDDEFAEEETTSNTSKKGDEAFAKAKAGLSKSDLDDQAGFFLNFPPHLSLSSPAKSLCFENN